jgi:hypothetical protein
MRRTRTPPRTWVLQGAYSAHDAAVDANEFRGRERHQLVLHHERASVSACTLCQRHGHAPGSTYRGAMLQHPISRYIVRHCGKGQMGNLPQGKSYTCAIFVAIFLEESPNKDLLTCPLTVTSGDLEQVLCPDADAARPCALSQLENGEKRGVVFSRHCSPCHR